VKTYLWLWNWLYFLREKLFCISVICDPGDPLHPLIHSLSTHFNKICWISILKLFHKTSTPCIQHVTLMECDCDIYKHGINISIDCRVSALVFNIHMLADDCTYNLRTLYLIIPNAMTYIITFVMTYMLHWHTLTARRHNQMYPYSSNQGSSRWRNHSDQTHKTRNRDTA
jgi:hypothetical protein